MPTTATGLRYFAKGSPQAKAHMAKLRALAARKRAGLRRNPSLRVTGISQDGRTVKPKSFKYRAGHHRQTTPSYMKAHGKAMGYIRKYQGGSFSIAVEKNPQKLLTKEVLATLPPLYSQEKVADPIARVKFFTPWTNWTWYATEFDGTDTFFGLVYGHEEELGYFSLSELQSIRGPGGLRIERDMYFKPVPLSKVKGTMGGATTNPLTDKESATVLRGARDDFARARQFGWEGGGPTLAARAETAAGVVNRHAASVRSRLASGDLLHRVDRWTKDESDKWVSPGHRRSAKRNPRPGARYARWQAGHLQKWIARPDEPGIKLHRVGDNVRVHLSKEYVQNFKSRWPASGLPNRAIWFEFTPIGDLVDLHPDKLDGEAALALSKDAFEAKLRMMPHGHRGYPNPSGRANPPPAGRRVWWLLGNKRNSPSRRFEGTFVEARQRAVGMAKRYKTEVFIHEDDTMTARAPIDYVGAQWAVAHQGGWRMEHKPKGPPLARNPRSEGAMRTCIRDGCGMPFIKRDRRLPAPAGKARVFEDRYCLRCAERLPLADIITEVRAPQRDNPTNSVDRKFWNQGFRYKVTSPSLSEPLYVETLAEWQKLRDQEPGRDYRITDLGPRPPTYHPLDRMQLRRRQGALQSFANPRGGKAKYQVGCVYGGFYILGPAATGQWFVMRGTDKARPQQDPVVASKMNRREAENEMEYRIRSESSYQNHGKRQTAAQAYLAERVLYGGVPATRATIIRDLKKRGFPQAQIDRYLQGLELGRRVRGGRNPGGFEKYHGKGEVDPDGATELELFIRNDSELYHRQEQPIILHLMRRMRAGSYDHEKSVTLWLYLVDAGAKKYIKEVGGVSGARIDSMFNKATRRAVAESMRDYFETEAKLGNYDKFFVVEEGKKYRRRYGPERNPLTEAEVLAIGMDAALDHGHGKAHERRGDKRRGAFYLGRSVGQRAVVSKFGLVSKGGARDYADHNRKAAERTTREALDNPRSRGRAIGGGPTVRQMVSSLAKLGDFSLVDVERIAHDYGEADSSLSAWYPALKSMGLANYSTSAKGNYSLTPLAYKELKKGSRGFSFYVEKNPWYHGFVPGKGGKKGHHEAFFSRRKPTPQTHGHRYWFTQGPFKTAEKSAGSALRTYGGEGGKRVYIRRKGSSTLFGGTPMKNPRRGKAPTPSQVDVLTWFERDRSHIEIRNTGTDKTVAEWWDDDAQQMFEDGFFVSGRGDRALKNSVIEYALSVGLLRPEGVRNNPILQTLFLNPPRRNCGSVCSNPSHGHPRIKSRAPVRVAVTVDPRRFPFGKAKASYVSGVPGMAYDRKLLSAWLGRQRKSGLLAGVAKLRNPGVQHTWVVTRDRKELARFTGAKAENEAWKFVHNVQSQSVDWAVKHEGYDLIALDDAGNRVWSYRDNMMKGRKTRRNPASSGESLPELEKRYSSLERKRAEMERAGKTKTKEYMDLLYEIRDVATKRVKASGLRIKGLQNPKRSEWFWDGYTAGQAATEQALRDRAMRAKIQKAHNANRLHDIRRVLVARGKRPAANARQYKLWLEGFLDGVTMVVENALPYRRARSNTRHAKRNPSGTVSARMVSVPWKNGQRIPVEKARAWIASLKNPALLKQFDQAAALQAKANRKSTHIVWKTIPVGSEKTLDSVMVTTHYGNSPELMYAAPHGSRKGTAMYRHKWGEGTGRSRPVPVLAAPGGRALIIPLGPGQKASDWLRG